MSAVCCKRILDFVVGDYLTCVSYVTYVSRINEGASEIDSKSVPHQGSSECESTDAKRPKIMAPVLPGVGKTPKGVVEEYIDSNKVVIFSKSTCPYCVKVS